MALLQLHGHPFFKFYFEARNTEKNYIDMVKWPISSSLGINLILYPVIISSFLVASQWQIL
jgi:hypothetical protein